MAGNIASSLLVACFTGDTRLVVPEGLKRIDAFREGDLVGSRGEHEPNGPLEWKRVLRVFQRLAPIVELQVAGRILRTTLEHPFRPVEGVWTPAGELELGQLLVTLQGVGVPVESLRATGEMATVYNLEVEDHHTYFVSGDDWGFAVWAHNANYGAKAKTELHHSDPLFMGGSRKQKRTPMLMKDHRGAGESLHNDLNTFLRGKTDGAGNHMRPQRGNSAVDIQGNFTKSERQAAMAEFYTTFRAKYPDAARDFFGQHPHLELR